ncbi:MAG: type II toxin-antitoxin system YoeB family toxin [Prolixibacteraceae bacterium]|nr:type II toxin-antitoxin system YoeB family toxin [Prolixibacteraceae bacterium]
MKYELIISEDAEKDFLKHRKSGDKAAILKLNDLLNELREHPYSGTGRPKPLGHDRAANGQGK